MIPPLPSPADLSRDPDAAWDTIALHVDRKALLWSPALGQWVRSAAWWEEALRDAWKAQAAKRRAEAEAREREAQRSRPKGRGMSDRERAAAYLATMGTGPNGAWLACLYAVRGFGLGADRGADVVWSAYVPRYHRKIKEGEVRSMARRAEKTGTMTWGKMLEARR